MSQEFFVIEVDEEGVCLECGNSQVEDVLYNIKGNSDVLMTWDFPFDTTEFPVNECILLPGKNDLKELNKLACTRIGLKSVSGTVKFYLCLQRN